MRPELRVINFSSTRHRPVTLVLYCPSCPLESLHPLAGRSGPPSPTSFLPGPSFVRASSIGEPLALKTGSEPLIHFAQTICKHPHDFQTEMRRLLHEGDKSLFIKSNQLTRSLGHDGCAPRFRLYY